MEVQFKAKKLQKQYENSKDAIKAYGIDVAKRYINRIGILMIYTKFHN